MDFKGYISSMTGTVEWPEVPLNYKYQFVGGALCLDFTNTVGGKRGGIARERLQSFEHLLCWSDQAGLLTKTQLVALRQEGNRKPEEAKAVYHRAVELREAIFRVFLAHSEGEDPAAADLAILNAELGPALARLQLAPEKKGFSLKSEGGSLDQPLGPIVRSAADLLTSHALLDQVHQCRGDNCGWLFADVSKNHSRRWCDMRDCGNRAKVRRHRLKQQKTD
jgi:predicted RNA-binding Zn ribbon-like protein